MDGQHHTPADLPPGKENRCLWYRKQDELQGRSGQVRKIPPPLGFDPQTVQPIASRYTDYAIPAYKVTVLLDIPLNLCIDFFNALYCQYRNPTTQHWR